MPRGRFRLYSNSLIAGQSFAARPASTLWYSSSLRRADPPRALRLELAVQLQPETSGRLQTARQKSKASAKHLNAFVRKMSDAPSRVRSPSLRLVAGALSAMARWAPPLSPHLPDPKCCAQRVCTEPAIVTGCRQDVQPLDHGSRPLLPLLLELPHRGAERCSSSGFDAFHPTKGLSSRAFSFASCLVPCYHNLLLLWLRVARTLTGY